MAHSMKDQWRPLSKAAIVGIAALALARAPNAKGAILLDDTSHQGNYSIVEDASTDGFDIMCTMRWGNSSDNVDANNQIAANGTFGSDLGLYKIIPTEMEHLPPGTIYTINSDSFNIQYASGTVNRPNDSDTFKFYFNLGDDVTRAVDAQIIVNDLNDLISGTTPFTSDQPWKYQRSINGEVTYDGITPKSFENSPSVYVIPEPMSIGLVGIGAGLVFGVRRLKKYAAF